MADKASWEDLPDGAAAPSKAKASWEDLPDAPGSTRAGPQEPGVLETVGHHALSGFWKDWSDEGVGALGRALAPNDPNARIEVKGGPSVPTTNPAGVQDALTRDERNKLAAQSNAHPYWAFLSHLAGQVGSDAVLRALGVPVDNPAYSAISGAVSGAGASEAKDSSHVLLDAAKGGAASLAADAVGRYVIPPLAKAVAPQAREWLENFAAKRAVKATGAIQNNIKGIPEEQLLGTGKTLLRQGVIRPFRTASDVKERAGEALDRLGPAIGDVLDKADKGAAEKFAEAYKTRGGQLGRPDADLAREAGAFDWAPVRQRLGEVEGSLSPVGESLGSGLFGKVEEAAQRGGGFRAANKLKSDIQDGAFTQADPKLKQRLARTVQGIIKDEVDSQLERQLGEQVGQEFRDSKKLYGAMADAEKWSQRGGERELGNRWLSPSDQAAGLAEHVSQITKGKNELQALPKVAAASFVSKLLRERGSSTLAVAADELAKTNPLVKLAAGQSGKLTSTELALLRDWLDRQQQASAGKE